MSKKLIICNTTFQLFTAINLRINVFKEDDVDIILTDNSDFSNIYLSLENRRIFNEVFTVKTRKYYYKRNNSRFKKITYLLKEVRRAKEVLNRELNLDFKGKVYEELYFSNSNGFLNIIYSYFKKVNSDLKLFEFEDGIGSYIDDKSIQREKVFSIKRMVQPKMKPLSGVYLYDPRLKTIDNGIPINKLPTIDKNNTFIREIYNSIYEYNDRKAFEKEFILFEQAFLTDNVFIKDELKLLNEVVEVIGEDNLTVKLHPRSKDNRFLRGNLEISEGSTPFEVICLNEDIDNKVLITINSGAAITPAILFGSKCKTILLYRLLSNDTVDMNSSKLNNFFINLQSKYKKNIYIPNNKKELESILKYISN